MLLSEKPEIEISLLTESKECMPILVDLLRDQPYGSGTAPVPSLLRNGKDVTLAFPVVTNHRCQGHPLSFPVAHAPAPPCAREHTR